MIAKIKKIKALPPLRGRLGLLKIPIFGHIMIYLGTAMPRYDLYS